MLSFTYSLSRARQRVETATLQSFLVAIEPEGALLNIRYRLLSVKIYLLFTLSLLIARQRLAISAHVSCFNGGVKQVERWGAGDYYETEKFSGPQI